MSDAGVQEVPLGVEVAALTKKWAGEALGVLVDRKCDVTFTSEQVDSQRQRRSDGPAYHTGLAGL